VLGFVTDAALVGPRMSTVPEAGEAALRELASTIPALQFFLQAFGAALKHGIRGNANNILNAEEFSEFIEQRQSETSVGTQFDFHAGKSGF
jgi:hypothetical protein